MSALAPTNHCEEAGPEHSAPPAQLPDLLCHTTGVDPCASNSKESSLQVDVAPLLNQFLYFCFATVGIGSFWMREKSAMTTPKVSVGTQLQDNFLSNSF
jgi:hypothetical protein